MRRAAVVLAAGVLVTACEPTHQAALHAVGLQAQRIEQLWWWGFGVTSAVFVLVVVSTALGVMHRASLASEGLASARAPDPDEERRLSFAVGGATVVATLLLGVLLLGISLTGRALATLRDTAPALTVEVVGHRGWWQLTYVDEQPSRRFVTANELHVPVGQPVKLVFESREVIHALGVPELAGTLDAVPGRQNELILRATEPGTWRGPCAELCDVRQETMGLRVVVEEPSALQAWLAAQRQPAPVPSTAAAARGLQVFLSRPCAGCHAVQGTQARGTSGPDLTHVMSRQALGGRSLPNERSTLSSWVSNPQHHEPGALMPAVALPPEEFEALLAFLEGLR